MKIREEILQKLESSTDVLMKAAVREIDRMMREGMTLDDILVKLRVFRLPATQMLQLKQALDDAMNDILDARSSVVDELSDSDIATVKSAAQISFPKLQQNVQVALIPTVQRAIAANMGPTALMHQLKQLNFDKPKTLALTSLSQFNNELTIVTAQEAGMSKFLWDGAAPIVGISHALCLRNAGKVFTLKQLDAMDNGCGLPVRSSLGGYRCVHYLTAME